MVKKLSSFLQENPLMTNAYVMISQRKNLVRKYPRCQ